MTPEQEHRCPIFAMDTSHLAGFEPGDFRCCFCQRITRIDYNTVAYCPSCGRNLHARSGHSLDTGHGEE